MRRLEGGSADSSVHAGAQSAYIRCSELKPHSRGEGTWVSAKRMVQLFGLIYPQRCVADNGKMRVIVFEIKIVKHIQLSTLKNGDSSIRISSWLREVNDNRLAKSPVILTLYLCCYLGKCLDGTLGSSSL